MLRFLLAVLALGIGLRHSRRPELLGWLAPAAALAAMSIFVVFGETSRRAAPPTVAVAQVVDAISGKEEASVHGLMAVYRPDSGAADLGGGHVVRVVDCDDRRRRGFPRVAAAGRRAAGRSL